VAPDLGVTEDSEAVEPAVEIVDMAVVVEVIREVAAVPTVLRVEVLAAPEDLSQIVDLIGSGPTHLTAT
jgi:hypothetical protein